MLMFEIFGISSQALFGQLLIGMLNIINFTHGAQYMMRAFAAYLLLQYFGISYWWSLLIAPIVIGFTGVLIERNLIAQLNSSSKLRTVVFLGSTAVLFLLARPSFGPTLGLAVATAGGFAVVEAWAYFRPPSESAQHVDHLYGLLLTFGIALIIQGVFRNYYGSSGLPYRVPDQLQGTQNRSEEHTSELQSPCNLVCRL